MRVCALEGCFEAAREKKKPGPGRLPHFCCAEHKYAAHLAAGTAARQRTACELDGCNVPRAGGTGQRYCSPEHRLLALASTCVQCGVSFESARDKGQAKYCGATCRAEARATEWAERAAANRCRVCGVPCPGKCCSAACKWTYHQANRSKACSADGCALLVHARGLCPKHYSRAVSPPSTVCSTCGEVTPWAKAVPPLCAVCAAEQMGNVRHRALARGVPLTPRRRHAVFERDLWLCQICGDPVNRSAHFPELDAATIDHRVALAVGGEHAPDNWQTAHHYCNIVKQTRPMSAFA